MSTATGLAGLGGHGRGLAARGPLADRLHPAASLRDVVLTRLQGIPEVRSTQTVLIFEEVTPVRHRP